MWSNYGTYSHGYLTILLSVFLIYTCIKDGRFEYTGPSMISIVCIAAVSVVWFLAYVASINTIQMLCLPLFVFFIICYFIGFKNIPVLLIPVLILLFTVPIWSSTLPMLQDIAVLVTDKLLSISSLDYRVVGNQVIFSKGIFEIEESCSGLRYLLVGVLLSIVYGFLNYKSIWSTLLLVLVAIVIMLIGNFIRILTVIGLGVIKGMDYPLVQDHENLGWVLFALFLLPLFITAYRINPMLWKNTAISRPVTQEKISHDGFNDRKGGSSLFSLLLMFVVYLVVISAAPLYANYIKSNLTEMASIDSSAKQLGPEWQGPLLLPSGWAPRYISFSDHFGEKYKKSEKIVTFNAYLYTEQVPEGELINTNNQVADKNRWSVSDSAIHQRVTDDGGANSIDVNQLTIQARQSKDCLRIWYWFEVNGVAYTKGWQVKLNEALMNLNGGSGSAIMSVSTSCENNPDLVLGEFLFDNFTQIKSLINW